MSHNCNYQHIVFRTYKSRRTLPLAYQRTMFAYISKICETTGSKLLCINAHENHVHMLVNVAATISLQEFVGKVKSMSSKAFKGHRLFPDFEGWGAKYGSFSVSKSNLKVVSEYIKNQQQHHMGMTFYEEMKRLVELNGGDINEFFADDFGENDEIEET